MLEALSGTITMSLQGEKLHKYPSNYKVCLFLVQTNQLPQIKQVCCLGGLRVLSIYTFVTVQQFRGDL